MISRRSVLSWGAALAAGGGSGALAQTRIRLVAITQIVEHPDLDQTRKGLTDAMRDGGFGPDKVRIVFESAQGDISTAVQIAQRFVAMSPDVIAAVSTPSAQSVMRDAGSIPVVFANVGDPKAAGIVKDLAHPGGNVTGSAGFTPVEPQLDLIKRLLPNAKRIGILGNPAEVNSRVAIDSFVKLGSARGYTFLNEAVNSSAEVVSVASNLVGRVDALYAPTDNTVVSGFEGVARLTTDNKLPFITSIATGARRGALAAVGIDQYDIGLEAGRMIVRILGGEKPGDIPVFMPSKTVMRLNLKVAASLGLAVPPGLRAEAVEVFS